MNIFVDENIPRMTVLALQALGHDVVDIRGTVQQGLVDADVWVKAQAERRMLITTDKGFTEHRNELHHGLLIVRLRQPNRQKIHERVMQAMAQFTAEEWPGLTIVARDNVQSTWRSS